MLHIISTQSQVVRKPGFLRNLKFSSQEPRCSFPLERAMFGEMGALPGHPEAPWSQLGAWRFYPQDEWSTLSSLVGISGAGAHSGLALYIFHCLCSVHLGTICNGKNIAGSSLLKALHFLQGGNTRQEKKKKKSWIVSALQIAP